MIPFIVPPYGGGMEIFMRQSKKSFSWPAVVVMFFLFFPVGIWMLMRKVSVERDRAVPNGKGLRIFGGVLLFLAAVELILFASNSYSVPEGFSVTPVIIVMLLLIYGGFFFARKGTELLSNGERYNRYAAIIGEAPEMLISHIAVVSASDPQRVTEELQGLIDGGWFPGCHVDYEKQKFILDKAVKPVPVYPISVSAGNSVEVPEEEPPAPVTVQCPHCGAISIVVPGEIRNCEYCGLPFSPKQMK